MPKLLEDATQKVHLATANICQDMHRMEVELQHPAIRRWARLLLIVAMGALLIAAIVLMAMRIPEFQSDKKTFPGHTSCKEVLAEGVQKHHSVNCPCQTQVVSWCQMTTFHVYKATPNETQPFRELFNVTKDQGKTLIEGLCTTPGDEVASIICDSIVSPVIDNEDARTYLPTASAYARPELLYTDIFTRIDTNEYEQSTILTYLTSSNQTVLYNYSDGLTGLLRDMARQFNRSSSSSSEDYWNAAQKTRNTHPGFKFSFGMDVNWTAYLEICNPSFCDVEYQVSLPNRVLRAAAQVGGVTTIISLAVKFLLWPLLRFALNFSAIPPTST